MDRRDFFGMAAGAAAGMISAPAVLGQRAGIRSLEEFTVAELMGAMRSKQLTSLSIVGWYLARIRAMDSRVRSMIELNPDVTSIARQLDRDRRLGIIRGPLHGIPVVIKDNIDTADRMKTTAGSLALAAAPTPKQDAFIVKQLRAAGAVILGKTNLSEWANFRDDNSISGWSGRGGQTHNPYILDRNPCGSSAGTGAAISANFAAIGIGTETDGSIVCPSSICGIVGIKPTIGLVSRSGIIPISASQDTSGPMCRTVTDAAILLNVIAGGDPLDPVTEGHGKTPDYTSFLKADGLKGKRIGVARDYWGRNPVVDKVLDAALDVLKKSGAELIDVKFPNMRKFGGAEGIVLQYEFKDGLEKYFRARGSQIRTLDDLIAFNKENAVELKYFGQSTLLESAKRGSLDAKEYLDAVETCHKYAREEGIDEAVRKYKVDVFVGPSNAPTWMIDTVNGDCGSGYVGSSSMPAVAGYPNITVPAGFAKELPIGASFFGPAFSEGTLIGIAYAFEQASKARRKPKFLPTYK